ncbi:MAG: hypothetical protein LAT65_05915 [Saccharospirillum sp.]|nr:hypothetical protein [Saccharospirillum sp.]
MIIIHENNELYEWPGFQPPQSISTNLPPDSQYWVRACSTVSGSTELAGYVENGELSISFEALKDQEFNYIAFEQDGDTNLYMALNTTLTEAAPQLQFQSATGGDIGDGDTGDGSLARIAGTVQIDGTPAVRDVLVISNETGSRKVLAEAASEPDGTFDITYPNWIGAVIALALDNYGDPFAPETTLNQGAIIHPTTPNGYVFEATTAGTTGTEEPAWNTGGNTQSGSVSFNARPYYRPIASGPLNAEVLEEGQEPEPETGIEATHIRITIMENQGSTGFKLALSDIRVIDTDDNEVSVASASATNWATNFGIDKALDADPTTFWSSSDSASLPISAELVFSESVRIDRISIQQAEGSNRLSRALKAFYLETKEGSEADYVAAASYQDLPAWTVSETRVFDVE